MSVDTKSSAIDRLIAGIEAGSIPHDVFADDVVLDATVPNWRFDVRGRGAVQDQLAKWFADPGRFQAIQRTPLPDGELVEFTLVWTEGGIEHTCHQAHIIRTRGNSVSTDTMFCGGRWPADLLSQMEATKAESA